MTARKHPNQWKSAWVHENDMGEFRAIPGTGGSYKISKCGVVVSNRRRHLPARCWIVLKHSKSKKEKPFNRVSIMLPGEHKRRPHHVSRLILKSWVGPPPSDLHVAAHRNGITDDDRLENLLWAKMKDVKHSQIYRGTWVRGERARSAKFTREQIEAARKIISEYGVSQNLLAKLLGMPQPRVREWLKKNWNTQKWDDLKNPLKTEFAK